ncbi:MAG: ribonuclease Y [Candidatus Omnitrophica bacterium]|nr:ribonuclease Y [Candidatus Omnitrophota bacterium]
MESISLVAGFFLVAIGILLFFAGYILRKIVSERRLKSAEFKAKQILEDTAKEAEVKRKKAELEAKDLLYKIRSDFERKTADRRTELQSLENRLVQKEENLDRKVEVLDKKEKDIVQRFGEISQKEAKIRQKAEELETLLQQEKEKLQDISGLSAEGAKRLLLSKMEGEIRHEGGLMIKRIENEARETAEKKAKNIISLAIQRCATEHTVESTVSVVNLPNDEMKGRIIGREGRNIRALEIATGIDVIIDDTPEAVILSGFDVVRREIARIALEKLIIDGRIHPARIEEVVGKAREEMEVNIREEGEKAVFDVGLHGINPELVKLVGRLKYRTSYGQNVLQHSREVAFLMGIMASELNLDSALAKRIGLLHDIGKAVDYEIEGAHNKIGADLARKYGESPMVVYAIKAHHDEIEQNSIYAVLTQAADAISATRPGARRETLESYIKRLEKLESLANSFKGVEKTYAIQAGREVRVVVQPNKISDGESVNLAREITKKIESELEYPGQIKVTVIRETRAIEYAK